MIIPLNFGLQSNPGRAGHDGDMRLVNCYAEDLGAEGKSQWGLYASEGLTAFATLQYGGPVQAMIDAAGTLSVVGGGYIYTVTSGGGVVPIRAFPSLAHVTTARNRRVTPVPQYAFCGGGYFYTNYGGTIQAATTNITDPIACCQVKGVTVVVNAAGAIGHSAIDDTTTWSGTAIGDASAQPDGLVGCLGRGLDLLLFGEESLEFWRYVGSTPFGFTPISGTAQKVGCASTGSIAEVPVRDGDVTQIFVASDNTVREVRGYQAASISTPDIERLIRDLSDKSTLRACAYTVPGHSFYVLSCADWTRAYDTATGRWHDKESRSGATRLGRWRGNAAVVFGGETYIGDYASGAIYKLRHDAYDEAGEAIVYEARAHLHAYPDKLKVNALYFDVIPGQGLNSTTAEESEPQAMVEVSRDNGRTWLPVRHAEIGAIGEHSRRVVMRRFGVTGEDGLLVKLTSSSRVLRGLTGAAADVEKVRA